MSGISTHVLNTALGKPAIDVKVTLERSHGGIWEAIATSVTNSDGRCPALLRAEHVTAGIHRIVFQSGAYFERLGQETLYPEIVVVFQVATDGAGYHIPLLLSPFGYSTYRGS